MSSSTREVPTATRIAGLERRDVARESAGYLVPRGKSVLYTCASCRTKTSLSESQLAQWTTSSRRAYRFQCGGCELTIELPLDLEELPSWSCTYRVVLGATLLESSKAPDSR